MIKYFLFFLLTPLLNYSCVEKDKKVPITKTSSIKGIDVSHHQGIIDWNRVANQNVKFCFIKATEGVHFIDSNYVYNVSNAKRHNIPIGAYHYYRVNRDIKEQFNNFTKAVPKGSVNFPPVIDVEKKFNEILDEGNHKETFINDLNTFKQMLHKYYGTAPIIYTDIKFYNTYLKGKIDDRLWMSDPGTSQLSYLDSSQWLFWQYSMRGKLDGINKEVDLNVFNGDIQQLNQLLIHQ